MEINCQGKKIRDEKSDIFGFAESGWRVFDEHEVTREIKKRMNQKGNLERVQEVFTWSLNTRVVPFPEGLFSLLEVVRLRAALKFLVIIPVFFAASATCLGSLQDYEARGTIQLKFFVPGATQEQAKVYFECAVKGCHWLIRIKTVDGTGFDYQEAAFDGSQIYYVSSLEKMVRQAQQEKGIANVPDNVATACVYKGEVFHNGMAMEVTPVWLAFASRCYLDQAKEGMLEPAVAMDASGVSFEPPSAVVQKAQWEMSSSQLRLPTKVVYFDDGIFRGYSLNRGILKSRPPPFDRGFTNAIYSVRAFTNIAGVQVPQSSVLDLFVPKNEGKQSTELTLRARYEIYLEFFKATTDVLEFVPKLIGKTYVNDFRFFQNAGVVGYGITNAWATQDEVIKKPGFNRRVKETGATHRQANPIISKLVILSIVISTWLGVAAYIKTNRNKKSI